MRGRNEPQNTQSKLPWPQSYGRSLGTICCGDESQREERRPSIERIQTRGKELIIPTLWNASGLYSTS